MRLVFGTRAGADEPLAVVGQSPERPRPLIRRPDLIEQTRGQQPRQRAGVEPVGLGFGLRDRPELAGVGNNHADPLCLQ
jgi:hypothetical protein